MSFTVIGTGHALPRKMLTNHELAEMIDTSDAWIVSKTGIRERRILSSESLTELSVKAAGLALENAGVKAADLDLIIFTTVGGDTVSPSMACAVAAGIGAACPAFDLNAACTGFIYALDVAAGYYARKKVKKTLIVSGEQMSRFLDWADRSTCVLFGDGAGAAVLGEGDGLLSAKFRSIPHEHFIRIPFTGGCCPYNTREYEKPCLVMNGQEVYKFAVTAAVEDLPLAIKAAGLSADDIDRVLLHQANMRIIDTAIKQLGIPKEKYINCIERTGNVSSASIPILLDEANRGGLLKRGDIIAMCAFGGGLTSGAAVLRW